MKNSLLLTFLLFSGCNTNLVVKTAGYNSTSAVVMRASDNSPLLAIRPNSTLICVLGGDETETSNMSYTWIGVSE